MKDRENNQSEKVLLPPAWCGSICKNAMSEVCVEHCAVNRDCSGFEEKPNLKLGDMPRFPKTEGMTKEEKFTSVTVYLSKVVDHLQGNETNEYIHPIRRPVLHRSGGSSLPQDVKVEDLLSGIQEKDSPSEDGKEHSNSGVRSSEVASNSD